MADVDTAAPQDPTSSTPSQTDSTSSTPAADPAATTSSASAPADQSAATTSLADLLTPEAPAAADAPKDAATPGEPTGNSNAGAHDQVADAPAAEVTGSTASAATASAPSTDAADEAASADPASAPVQADPTASAAESPAADVPAQDPAISNLQPTGADSVSDAAPQATHPLDAGALEPNAAAATPADPTADAGAATPAAADATGADPLAQPESAPAADAGSADAAAPAASEGTESTGSLDASSGTAPAATTDVGGAAPLDPATVPADAPSTDSPAVEPAPTESTSTDSSSSTELPGASSTGSAPDAPTADAPEDGPTEDSKEQDGKVVDSSGEEKDPMHPASAPDATVPQADQAVPEEHPVPAPQPQRIDPQSGVILPPDQQESPDGSQTENADAPAPIAGTPVPPAQDKPISETLPLEHPKPAEIPQRVCPQTGEPVTGEGLPDNTDTLNAGAQDDADNQAELAGGLQEGLAQDDANGYDQDNQDQQDSQDHQDQQGGQVRHEIEKMLHHVRGALKHEAENARKLMHEIESHLKGLLRRLKGQD